MAIGVGEKALKAAYRERALLHHPDRHPDDQTDAEATFKEINEAYALIACSGAEEGRGGNEGYTEEGAAAAAMAMPMCVVSSACGWGLDELVAAIVTQLGECGSDQGGAESGGAEGEAEGVNGSRREAGDVAGGEAAHIVPSGGGGVAATEVVGERSGAGAIVIEAATLHGLGMTVVVVVRSGVLRTDDWFALGAVSGRIRGVSLLQAGTRRAGGKRGVKGELSEAVSEADTGRVARVSIASLNDKTFGSHFEVTTLCSKLVRYVM